MAASTSMTRTISATALHHYRGLNFMFRRVGASSINNGAFRMLNKSA